MHFLTGHTIFSTACSYVLSPTPLLPPHFPQSDPEKWSVEEVCQWLELVGLGMYRQAFRGSC